MQLAYLNRDAMLCPDACSFFAQLPAVLASGAQPVLQACIQHSYLPPVDVELSLQPSGAAAAEGDYRSLVVQVRQARTAKPCCLLAGCIAVRASLCRITVPGRGALNHLQ
jgi:hypothetical protein